MTDEERLKRKAIRRDRYNRMYAREFERRYGITLTEVRIARAHRRAKHD